MRRNRWTQFNLRCHHCFIGPNQARTQHIVTIFYYLYFHNNLITIRFPLEPGRTASRSPNLCVIICLAILLNCAHLPKILKNCAKCGEFFSVRNRLSLGSIRWPHVYLCAPTYRIVADDGVWMMSMGRRKGAAVKEGQHNERHLPRNIIKRLCESASHKFQAGGGPALIARCCLTRPSSFYR